MIRSISWKNIWRNKNRSFVVVIAVTLGIISGILLLGIMKGWVEQRIHDAIYNEVSHVQIHSKEYLKNEEADFVVKNKDEVIKAIGSLPGITGWAKRTKMIAMANTSWGNTGVSIYGVEPEKERRITEIWKKVIPGAGEYLDESVPGTILISDKTAEVLKLKQYIITEEVLSSLRAEKVPDYVLLKIDTLKDIRFRSPKDFRDALRSELKKKELDNYGNIIIGKALDYRIRNKVQITISDETGTPVQGTFRVCGIYKTTNTGFDQTAAFVKADELAKLYDGKDVLTHEIAILLNDIENADNVRKTLSAVSPENEVNTWKELAPDAAFMNDYMVMYYIIFIGIIMLALAFGIINTMLMTILERTKELGMLMAIGMNRRKVFSMIMLETIFLTIVGAIAGMLSGWLIIELLGKTGIHFSSWGEGFEDWGFAAVVYPVITPDFFFIITVMVIVTAIISSIWPARKALKLNTVETLRTE
ncbi:MAG TPA: FtsX-like permease family protein [Bacteroidales bacterium]|nr:FtsX-like permease family protein [Bacteroidales bacterium]HPT21645.1 FtsX-like permease family protein [Bacteroidales bacterium]